MHRILLVEDNEMNADMLSRRLKRQGYSLAVASSGHQGMALVQSWAPHLILMDVGLPDIDGLEVTRQLKADEQTRHIPIIVLTAHATTGDREAALSAGCDDYDTKPIEMKRLLRKIFFQLSIIPPSGEGSVISTKRVLTGRE